MDSFYNYSSDVFKAQCNNLRELDQTKQVICIEIVNMLNTMDTLKKQLDQIIGERAVEVEAVITPQYDCWDLSLHQQYWNFNALHALSIYIKLDLDDLQTKLMQDNDEE